MGNSETINTLHTLPDGWIWTTLELVSKNITDGSHNPPGKQDSGIPMLSARNIENGKITFDEVRYISERDYEYENQRARIEAGDVLLTIVATIGRSAIIPVPIQQRFALQRSVAAIKPLINGHFLMYVFQGPAFQKLLTDNAKGTAQKGVYLKTLRELPIPLPPLEEQHRIVSKIEELFSELDHAEKGLKKAQKQLEVYKQALLKSAFEGNIRMKTNANWYKLKLGDIYDFIGGGTPSKKVNTYWKGNIPWASVKDISGMYLNSTQDKITIEGLNNSSANIAHKNNVILVSRINTGAVIISNLDVAINQDLKIIKSKNDSVDFKFIYYHFRYLQQNIIKYSKGTTVSGIRLNELNNIEVEMPELPIQTNVVFELERQFSNVDKLMINIIEGITKVKNIRHSILKKAFEGKLVSQNSNEESAKILIKKIQIEKKNYLEESALNKAIVNKPMKSKPLKEILNENFVGQEFSFDDIRNKTFLTYEELRDQLYKLLDELKLETVYNEKIQRIQFKLRT